MDHDNRINNNNPRRDISRSNRSNMERMGKVTHPDRPNKSEFQKVLEQSHNNFDPAQSGFGSMTTTVTKEAIQPAASQQERFGKDKEGFRKHLEKEDSKEDVNDKKNSSKESVAPRAKLAEKKVISRSSVSDHSNKGQQKGGGQSEHTGHQSSAGGSGSGQQSKKGRDFSSPFLVKNSTSLKQSGVGEVKNFQSDLHATQFFSPGSKAASLSEMGKVLSKAVIDQIIQYCRLVTKTDGDKEIDMQLKEEIFKGLRLKVSMVRGGVEAIFMAPSQEVLSLFQTRKSEIQKVLQEKGIEVRSLRVIIS